MGNEESRKFGAKGGRTRAANLSGKERIEAAKRAALARWGADLPLAEYAGVLQIGDLSLPCAVLSDHKTRVLTQTDFMRGMGMPYSGGRAARNRATASSEGSAGLPNFLAIKRLKPFIDKHLGDLHSIVVKYRTQTGVPAFGVRAEIIPKICEIWMDADDAGVLLQSQKRVAAKARMLMRALAYKAIEQLVDSATGFREDKDQREIAKFIEAYVAKELRQWVRTFPRSFFEGLCKLRGIPFPENMRLPQYFGHLINDVVWDRLAPGIREELQKRNPVENGRRKHKHFQFLTEHVGNPRLLHHLGVVEGLTEGFGYGEWDRFRAKLDAKLPSYKAMPLFTGVPAPTKIKRTRKALLPAAAPSAQGPGQISPISE